MRAERLYLGALFKKSLTYCQKHFDGVWILSAKYGLVSLDQVIEPYEKTLNNQNKKQRKEWSEKVKYQMEEKGLTADKCEFYFFCGVKYNEFFNGHKPLLTFPLGMQLKWFTDQNKKKKMKGFF